MLSACSLYEQPFNNQLPPKLGIQMRQAAGAVIIAGVIPNTPAARAGLLPNDVVLHYAGVEVSSVGQLQNLIHSSSGQVVMSVARLGAGALIATIDYDGPAPQANAGAADPPPETPEAASASDKIEQIERLHKLRESGALTDEEFQAEKAKLLDQ